jgi:hypothetical membrane protein
MAHRGPLVPAAAHQAARLFLIAVLQFVAAMAVVQARYPGYSDVADSISELGDPAHSPWHLLFDGSILLLGILGIAATYLVRVALRSGRLRTGGLGLLALANLGAIGVGLFPEGSAHDLHTLFAAVTFFASGFALLLLAGAMLRDTRWDGLRLFSAGAGIVTLGALGAMLGPLARSADLGLVERVVVAPILLWAVVVSIHLLRLPGYTPATGDSRSRSDG